MENIDNNLFNELNNFERNDLDLSLPKIPNVKEELNSVIFRRVIGMRFYGDKSKFSNQNIININNLILSSANSHSIGLLCTSKSKKNEIVFFLSFGSIENTDCMLKNSFPGIRISHKSYLNLDNDVVDRINNYGVISGIPTVINHKSDSDNTPISIDRLTRGMESIDWFYYVRAYSRDRQKLINHRSKLLSNASHYQQLVKAQIQESVQTSNILANTQNELVSQILGGEVTNYFAAHIIKYFEKEIERLGLSLRTGGGKHK